MDHTSCGSLSGTRTADACAELSSKHRCPFIKHSVRHRQDGSYQHQNPNVPSAEMQLALIITIMQSVVATVVTHPLLSVTEDRAVVTADISVATHPLAASTTRTLVQPLAPPRGSSGWYPGPARSFV